MNSRRSRGREGQKAKAAQDDAGSFAETVQSWRTPWPPIKPPTESG